MAPSHPNHPVLKRGILSAVIWAAITLLTILLFVVMLTITVFTSLFDKKRKRQHAQCFWWSEAVIRLNPYWHVTVSGLENIDRNRTYVVVANHQSLADIVLLFQTRMQFKWIAKDSLFRIPFLGWCLSLAGHVRLERNELSSIRRSYREASGWIDKGVSVMFFPEGTRSETGKPGPFHNGAFRLAREKKIAVLPIAIHGTASVMSKGKWVFNHAGTIHMTVLPSLESDYLQSIDMKQIINSARELIQATLQNSDI
jgi:1-acyl-sn-glycerol-3-phosphate acyltransferase